MNLKCKFYQIMAKLLIFLMIFNSFPFRYFNQEFRWDPANYENLFKLLIKTVSIKSAHATEKQTSMAIDNGFQWLLLNQSKDGYWGKTFETLSIKLKTSNEVLDSFALLKSFPSIRIRSCIDWAMTCQSISTEELSMLISILPHNYSKRNILMTMLATAQNIDGGWGAKRKEASDLYHTSFALKSLSNGKYFRKEILKNTITYYTNYIDNHSSMIASDNISHIIISINTYCAAFSVQDVNIESMISKLYHLLVANQNNDGGWGKNRSTVHETSLATYALYMSDSNHFQINKEKISNFLMKKYNKGSWNKNAYDTALAIKALLLLNSKNSKNNTENNAFLPLRVFTSDNNYKKPTLHIKEVELGEKFIAQISTLQNAIPIADAGNYSLITKNHSAGSLLSLDGSNSKDPDNDILQYRWFGPFGISSAEKPSVLIPQGKYTVTLIVSDGKTVSEADTATISVVPEYHVFAKSDNESIMLVWRYIKNNIEKYQIYRSNRSKPDQFSLIGETLADNLSYTDYSITNNDIYLYTINAKTKNEDHFSEVTSIFFEGKPEGMEKRKPCDCDRDGLCFFSTMIFNKPSADTQQRISINHEPVIFSSPVLHGTTQTIYNYDVNATDPDGDLLQYSLDDSPEKMKIDSEDGLITWTPSEKGSFEITIKVSDINENYCLQQYIIEVSDIDDTVVVPDVTNVEYTNAETMITNAGLRIGKISYQKSDSIPEMHIICQNPSGGSFTVTGTAIDLTISSNHNNITVPNFVGLDLEAAKISILEAKFSTGNISYQKCDNKPVNQVFAQNPLPGESHPEGTAIDLIVCSNNELVSVPDVRGLTIENAQKKLTSIGLSSGAISYLSSNTVDEGLIIIQNPEKDASVVKGCAVDLVVATKKTIVTVPDVINLLQEDAQRAIVSNKLSVGTIERQESKTVPEGYIISQQPEPGTSVIADTPVHLIVSTNEQPIITSRPVVKVHLSEQYKYFVKATHFHNKTLSFSLNQFPEQMIIDSSQGIISWQPENTGSYSVEVQVTDTDGAYDTQRYNVKVIPDQLDKDFTKPLVTLTIDDSIVNVGTTVKLTVEASDNEEVINKSLTVNGTPVSLDESGKATYKPQSPGTYKAFAVAEDNSENTGYSEKIFYVLKPGDTKHPQINIIKPVNGSKIKEPTDIIGTVIDENLSSYKLEYSPKGKNKYVEFASGTSNVEKNVLGRLDPTNMENGLYDIRLTVIDISGNIMFGYLEYIIEGNLKIGNFSLNFQDLIIPVSGISITVSRNYDSRNKLEGDYGIGWKLGLTNIKLNVSRVLGEGWHQRFMMLFFMIFYKIQSTTSHCVTVTFPDGNTEKFYLSVSPGGNYFVPVFRARTAFTKGQNTFSNLYSLDNNNVLLTNHNGPAKLVDSETYQVYDPKRYKLVTKDGTTYIIHKDNGLEKIIDTNDITVTFTSDGIIHSGGKSVLFDRDENGRIVTITDPKGNSIDYEYDSYGDLVTVIDQEANMTRFVYNSNHGLIDIIDPRGVRAVRTEYDDEGRVIATVDADGNRVEFTHNTDARQEVIKDRKGHLTIYEYDNNGNVLSKTDALGNTTKFSYDEWGNETSVTNALGYSTSCTYDQFRNVTTETDEFGNAKTFQYNDKGQVLQYKDPDGYTSTYNYNDSGNLISYKNIDGDTVTSNIFDKSGNLLSMTNSAGNTSEYDYNSDGALTKYIDYHKNETTYEYDNNGNHISQSFSAKDDNGQILSGFLLKEYDSSNRVVKSKNALGQTSITTFNEIGKKSSIIDSNGNETRFEYNNVGRESAIYYPDGTEESYAYDLNGNRTSHTNRNGLTTYYEYDALDRLVKTISNDTVDSTLEYDAVGKIIKSTDSMGNSTSYEYDAAGRKTKIIDPKGHVTQFTYNKHGNRLSMTDANGHQTKFEYDKLGRRIKTIFPDNSTFLEAYDALGRNVSQTDPNGNRTKFEYDESGKLTKVIDPYGNITSYTYNGAGNITSQIDPNGHKTQWVYNEFGQLIKKILPLGMFESFEYDSQGRLSKHSNYNGNSTVFEYNNLNLLTKRTLPDGTVQNYEYTKSGKIERLTNSKGVTIYQYDIKDRIIKVVNPDGSEISYTYDAKGNRASLTTASGTTTYKYDACDQLICITDPNGRVTIYEYDNVGNKRKMIYPNGTIAEFTYNALNRLINMVNKKSNGTIISSYSYSFDLVGNIISVEENNGTKVEYTYNKRYQLIKEQISQPGKGTMTITYNYDKFGNRISKNSSQKSTSYVYDANDRMIKDGSKTITYDKNGNMLTVSDGSTNISYTYNFDNQLISVELPGKRIEFEYNSEGIRTSKKVNDELVKYLVDMNRDYAQVIEETNINSSETNYYTYGKELISQSKSGDLKFFIKDGHGSTRELADLQEEITDTYDYDAFGNTINTTGNTMNHYAFSGEQYDHDLGFYYLRARYYNPVNGIFTTKDLIDGDRVNPLSLNQYLYCMNNPVNYTDPSGKLAGAILIYLLSFYWFALNLSISIENLFDSGKQAIKGFDLRKALSSMPDAAMIGRQQSFSPARAAFLFGVAMSMSLNLITLPFAALIMGGMMNHNTGGKEVLVPLNSHNKYWTYSYFGESYVLPLSVFSYEAYAGAVWNVNSPYDYEGPFYSCSASFLGATFKGFLNPTGTIFSTGKIGESFGISIGVSGFSTSLIGIGASNTTYKYIEEGTDSNMPYFIVPKMNDISINQSMLRLIQRLL